MIPVKKIVVTGDTLRINEHGRECQNINIRWLHHLVKPALAMLTDLPVEPLLHQRADGNLAQELYRSNGLEMWLRNWVHIYGRNPSENDLASIDRAFEGALVLAFELPEIIRAGLASLGIPYIDLTIHPVRFLDDVAFGIRSNVAGLGADMRDWVLTEHEIRIGTGLAMSTLARIAPPPECMQVEECALFACQTKDDKVLIRDGTLMQASDFLDDFAEMSSRHERIFVKTHPVAGSSPMGLLKRMFPNFSEITSNFYLLVAQESLSHVYSITSSTSIEARYFGKSGTHFAPYPYVFSEEDLTEIEYLQIRPALHLPQFWAPLLSRVGIDSRPPPPVDGTMWPNHMRRNLRNAWGADIFMGGP